MSESINITRTMASPSEPVQLVGSDIRRKRISVRVTKNLRTDPTVGTWWQPTPEMTNISFMFASYGDPWASLTQFPSFDTSNVTMMDNVFQGCAKLIVAPLLDTSKVTSMTHMFDSCSALTTVPLFNTVNVTDMNNMFISCVSLTTVPLFDTTNVINMNSMFGNCPSLTTIPSFNTMNVTFMGSMFSGCSSLTTIPSFNTMNVTFMGSMFSGCSSLTTIEMTGMKASFSIAQTAMQATAINTLFSNLATIPANSQTITVTGAPGATTCDRTIATAKGWIVA